MMDGLPVHRAPS